MKARTITTLALVAIAAAACKKGSDNAGGTDSTKTSADTSVVQGTDTVQKTVNQVVPTQDTVVKSTTTETKVDTVKGHATDTTHKAATDTSHKKH